MKKMTAIFLVSAISLASCALALSGCADGGEKFTLSEEGGKHYIVSYSALSSPFGEYEIPAYYGEGENYAPVTEIADEGFASTRFSKIKVPATVTKIGTAAFSFCYSLETVEFADGIALEKFSRGMFGESDNLQEIKIPDSVKTIEARAFSGCTSLSSVEMNSVESIGMRAFAECTALESVKFPSSLTAIGEAAFYGAGLKSIEIPDSVADTVTVDADGNEITARGLGYGAFIGCTSLESVRIGSGVSVIPSGAFGYCISLKEIYIPLSVKEIEGSYYENGTFRYGHAFYSDKALTDVYYEGTKEQWQFIKIETDVRTEGGTQLDNKALINALKHYNNEM